MPPEVVDEEVLRQREILRENLIFKTFHFMVDEWSPQERESCEINRQILHEVSNAYFFDMDRKKEFHRIVFADAHKRAGYLAKWIMRLRPVQLKREDVSKTVLLANEQLALLVALRMVTVPIESVSDSVIEHFLFMFRFRPLDGNALAMAFCLLQQGNVQRV